jgi:hypothetical protein
MAVQYFGIEKGGKFTTVTQDSSSTGKTIEVAVDLADGASKEQVIVALQNLKDYILQNKWPPA